MMKNDELTIERSFDASVEDVWKALTVKELMKEWYFDVKEFKLEKGFEFQFSAGETPEKQYVHLCEILEVIPLQKLSYTWRYEGYEGNSILTFELFPDGTQTRLKLTHTGLNTFPAGNPDFVFTNFVGGWDYFMNTSLPDFLKKIKDKA